MQHVCNYSIEIVGLDASHELVPCLALIRPTVITDETAPSTVKIRFSQGFNTLSGTGVFRGFKYANCLSICLATL